MIRGTELWYVTRGSGVVALLLLTAGVSCGILTALRVSSTRWPRFAIGSLHRNLTLLAVVFVALHVVTTVADGYAPIGLQDAIVPFASPYRPIWLGLGTVAFDLLLALVVTSYLRRRIGVRIWRAVHWLAYASWPVAVVHSLGAGTDARTTWLPAVALVCVLAVSLSVVARVALGGGLAQARVAGAAAAVVVPLAIAAWWHSGPAQRGWAARAGTPHSLLASHRRVVVRRVFTSDVSSTAPRSFATPVTGTIRETRDASGFVRVVLRLTLENAPHGKLRIDLRGPAVGGGVSLAASGVAFVPATTRAVYYGSVTGLDGSLVAARVKDAAGDVLQLTTRLALDAATGRANGTLVAASGQGDGG